jgi:itaconate CoA-transferase
MGIQNEREWRVFCEQVLRRPELADDPQFNSVSRRVTNREKVKQIVDEVFGALRLEQIVALLDSAGIANARMNGLDEVWNHPQLAARKRWSQVGSPAGPIATLLPPGIPCGVTPRMDPVPGLGEHTGAILAELGYSQSEVERLRTEKVIG